ncbi:MAG: glycoside hydrolase family 3 protein [Treponema sp.]|nr:glycoside hydrolase family 3 protein [Treponema sp.]
MIRKFQFVSILLFFLASPIFSLNFFDDRDPAELAADLEKAMSDDEALAQVFMLGWVGAEPSPLIMDWIYDRNIGGVKIFGWNTGDTIRLARTVGALQEASLKGKYKIPLLVATDQEGGWIRHVKGNTSITPGNMAIGASGYPRDAYLAGYYIGKELALLGVNMNFAPTVDLFTNRDSWLISTRAFGSDPVKVGIFGAAYMKGQQAAGIIPTAKHFPGHGDTQLDSHGVLPKINVTFETLWERELIPYRMLVREGIPAVMSGHLAFPSIEKNGVPASLSSWFLKDVLREKIGYKGLVITDDLMMNGATIWAGSVSRAAKQALLAGNDIILFSKTPDLFDPVWNLLSSSMKDDREFHFRVRESARRTLETKLRYLKGSQAVPFVPDIKKVENGLPDPEGSAFFLELAARSVTIVKPSKEAAFGTQSEHGVFPLKPEVAGKVLLTGQYLDFFRVGRAAFPGAVSYWYSEDFKIDDLLTYARAADTVIFCLSDTEGLRILRRLESLKKRIIVLSVLNPVYLENIPWIDGAIAVYSDSFESLAAGFSAIIGRIPAEGRLPYE